MKYMLIVLAALIAVSCNYSDKGMTGGTHAPILQYADKDVIPLILPRSFEDRRKEFRDYVNAARDNIRDFSVKYGWEELTREEFIDSIMIFDNKNKFNTALLKIAGADTSIALPDTYCAALENRILVSVSPEYYAEVYPEGIEDKSFEKLLTHEIAHRLHIRILNGDEDAMGPVWFYEGFAMYIANQIREPVMILSKSEMIQVINDTERGSYMKYNYIFRYFAGKIPLKEMVLKAKNKDFNEEMILILN